MMTTPTPQRGDATTQAASGATTRPSAGRVRPRRLRSSAAMRNLVAETRLHPAELILPMFVREGVDSPVPITSMPGVVQHSLGSLVVAAREAADAGVGGLMLFGVPSTRDASGTKANSKQLRQARKSIGMIFQHFNLVANKTVYENVLISLELAKYPKAERKKRVLECLEFVGLESMLGKYPAHLSGGQKQRVAIARSLANHPQVLLCDELTSSLDPHTTAEILSVLNEINKSLGVTIVMVSHEMDVIKSICSQVSVMSEGTIYETVSIQPKGIQVTKESPTHLVEQLTKDGEDHA